MRASTRVPSVEPRSRRPGFTLVEVVVVVVILGVTAAVAAPVLGGARGGEAAAAARELAGALQAARNAAVDRGRGVALYLDAATGAYAVATVPPPGPPDTLHAGRLPVGPGLRVDAPGGSRVSLVFDPLRRMRGATVRIVGRDERFDVTTDAWTSIIRIRRR